jgi:hypothetical protein
MALPARAAGKKRVVPQCVAVSRAQKNAGGGCRGRSEATDLGERNHGETTAAKRKQSCYMQCGRTPFFYPIVFNTILYTIILIIFYSNNFLFSLFFDQF